MGGWLSARAGTVSPSRSSGIRKGVKRCVSPIEHSSFGSRCAPDRKAAGGEQAKPGSANSSGGTICGATEPRLNSRLNRGVFYWNIELPGINSHRAARESPSIEGTGVDARCRIELLGELRVRQSDRTLTRFRTQKAALLLSYLALHLGQSPTRE